jgi:hypothetical protein
MKSRPHSARTKAYTYLLGGGFIALLVALAFRLPGDPDMGWHLRSGQDLLAKLHFPVGDPYSWTMPNFDWVPHEWGTDVVMALIHSHFGLWGLTVAFAIIIAGIFLFAAGVKPTDLATRGLIAVIALSVSYHIVGARPQMMSLLGLAITLSLLFKFRDHPRSKSIYWLPIVFLVWANLHGGFVVGFLAIAVFTGAELIRRVLLGKVSQRYPLGLLSWPMVQKLGWISLVSIGATLINPSGWGVYREVYQTLSNSYALNSIAEWLSVTVLNPMSYNLILMSGLIVVLLFVNRWQADTTKLILAVVFFWFGVESWRNIPLFAIAALPLLSEQMVPLMSQPLQDLARWWPVHLGTWAILLLILKNFFQMAIPTLATPAAYAERLGYPYGAIQYLKQSVPPAHLLNEYNWGGYLIWQYPEAKVFIDGRMAIWEQDGIKIFQEFQDILGDNPAVVIPKLKQWQIDTILTYSNKPINLILGSTGSSWKVGYRDNLATVWRLQSTD